MPPLIRAGTQGIAVPEGCCPSGWTVREPLDQPGPKSGSRDTTPDPGPNSDGSMRCGRPLSPRTRSSSPAGGSDRAMPSRDRRVPPDQATLVRAEAHPGVTCRACSGTSTPRVGRDSRVTQTYEPDYQVPPGWPAKGRAKRRPTAVVGSPARIRAGRDTALTRQRRARDTAVTRS